MTAAQRATFLLIAWPIIFSALAAAQTGPSNPASPPKADMDAASGDLVEIFSPCLKQFPDDNAVRDYAQSIGRG
jgi:hypothetical protein